MYAKTGVNTTVATFGTGALHWRADAEDKFRESDSGAPSCFDALFLRAMMFYYFTAWLFGCVDQSWLHKLLKRCQTIF